MEKTMAAERKIVGTRETRESGKEIIRSTERGQVAIWLEMFKEVRGQWEEAEHGRFHHITV